MAATMPVSAASVLQVPGNNAVLKNIPSRWTMAGLEADTEEFRIYIEHHRTGSYEYYLEIPKADTEVGQFDTDPATRYRYYDGLVDLGASLSRGDFQNSRGDKLLGYSGFAGHFTRDLRNGRQVGVAIKVVRVDRAGAETALSLFETGSRTARCFANNPTVPQKIANCQPQPPRGKIRLNYRCGGAGELTCLPLRGVEPPWDRRNGHEQAGGCFGRVPGGPPLAPTGDGTRCMGLSERKGNGVLEKTLNGRRLKRPMSRNVQGIAIDKNGTQLAIVREARVYIMNYICEHRYIADIHDDDIQENDEFSRSDLNAKAEEQARAKATANWPDNRPSGLAGYDRVAITNLGFYCLHMGDPDFDQATGALLVPRDKCYWDTDKQNRDPEGDVPANARIEVLRRDHPGACNRDLIQYTHVNSVELLDLTNPRKAQRSASWVAWNGADDTIVVPAGNSTTMINVFEKDPTDQHNYRYQREVFLDPYGALDELGSPLSNPVQIRHMQGGDFQGATGILWISSDGERDSYLPEAAHTIRESGLRAFQFGGQRAGYLPGSFLFISTDRDDSLGQVKEIEGIDFTEDVDWQFDVYGVQDDLHLLVLYNGWSIPYSLVRGTGDDEKDTHRLHSYKTFDVCSNDPRSSTRTCGDGVVACGEVCDDGNTNSGDGCNSTCTAIDGGVCGDGLTTPPEQCDDGAGNNGAPPSLCRGDCGSYCGDGVVQGAEACELGQAGIYGSTCNKFCSGFCGDGNRDPGERCDNGDLWVDVGDYADGVKCSADCTAVLAACGDGVLQPEEKCDPSVPGLSAVPGVLNVGCNDTCQSWCGPLPYVDPPTCPNGLNSECDPGDDSWFECRPGNRCVVWKFEPQQDAECDFGPYNGVPDSPNNPAECDVNCTYGIDPGETCAPDGTAEVDHCGSTTTVPTSGCSCDDGCLARNDCCGDYRSVCGGCSDWYAFRDCDGNCTDKRLELGPPNPSCDVGNPDFNCALLRWDDLSPECMPECDVSEIKDCQANCVPRKLWGDGVCHDGKSLERPWRPGGPDLNCAGFNFDGMDCVIDGCPPRQWEDCKGHCWPARWVGDDFCDDGARGADFFCEEFIWDWPAANCGAACGNGRLDPHRDRQGGIWPEECDDGNRDDGDGCDRDCLSEGWCGDGIESKDEECDSSDPNSDYPALACDVNCLLIHDCGNGKEEEGEECDDGNGVDGDGCSGDCEVERDHTLFITAATYAGNLGGMLAADALCSQAALAGGRTGDLELEWTAWMSVDGADAASRIRWRGDLFNSIGQLVKAEPADAPLPWDRMLARIGLDENGVDLGEARTHTGTSADGTSSGVDCDNWTSASPAVSKTTGNAGVTASGRWFDGEGEVGCHLRHRLMCVSR